MFDDGRDVFPIVPPEADLRRVELEIDLTFPADFSLADICGHSSRLEEGRGRLRGRCEPILPEFVVRGGRGREVLRATAGTTGSEITFMAMAAHQERARAYLESLSAATRLIDRLGDTAQEIGGLDDLVILERTPDFSFERRLRFNDSGYDLSGRLLLVDEVAVLRGAYRASEGYYHGGILPTPETLVAFLFADRLYDRRAPAVEQSLLLRNLLRAVMSHRMGVSRQKDARLSSRPEMKPRFEVSLLEFDAKFRFDINWMSRLPAIIFDLERRVGTQNMIDGIFAWVRESSREGRVEDLFEIWEELSGIDLERFYQEYFAGHAMPELELIDVVSRADGDGFEVEGKVRNQSDGQVICPVIVRSEIATQKVMVTISGEMEAPFRVRTSSRPTGVVLDPEGTCYRYMWGLASELEQVDL